MDLTEKPSHRRILSGTDHTLAANAIRGTASLLEPFYASVMRARNFAFDHGLKKIHRLARPAVAVGNLTTGGTGKTPMVRWLMEQFVSRNLRPAILLRGYRSEITGGSDEARMLKSRLGDRAIVVTNPDRVAGAAEAMKQIPPPDVFILDDAFQHRRVWRDFNLLLINAAEPFGLGHVLPRGYLREPVCGIRRADAIVMTRADQVAQTELQKLRAEISRLAGAIPAYQASHTHTGLRCGDQTLDLEELGRRRTFVFSGIANPESFYRQLPHACGMRSFADHHAYTPEDLEGVRRSATAAGAEILLTTEKDWIKLAGLSNLSAGLPIWRVEMQIRFHGDDEQKLLEQIEGKLQTVETAANP